MTKYIWAKALWDFEAGEDDELNFFKGDLFKINEADIQRPWGNATSYDRKTGKIPMNRVEIISPTESKFKTLTFDNIGLYEISVENTADDSSSYSVTIKGKHEAQKKLMKSADEFIALNDELIIFMTDSTSPNDNSAESLQILELIGAARTSRTTESFNNLLKGILNCHILLPTLIVWLFPGTNIDSTFDDVFGEGVEGDEYEVLYDWEPESSDELRLVRGEAVFVTEKPEGSGWCVGYSKTSGLHGVFPLNYVSAKHAPRPPPRQRSGNEPKTFQSSPVALPVPPVITPIPTTSSTTASTHLVPGGPPVRGDSGIGRMRPFSLQSLDAFDQLLSQGVSCEILSHGSGAPIQPNERVELSCRAMTWDGAHTATNPFADTLDGAPLCFQLGQSHVTAGLEAGVLQLREGDVARITAGPAMAYGDAGHPPSIPPRSYVVYEVTVRKVGGAGTGALPSGPSQLLGAGVANLKKPRSTERSPLTRTVTVKLLNDDATAAHPGSGSAFSDDQLLRAAASMGLKPSSNALSIPEESEESEETDEVTTYPFSRLLVKPLPSGVDPARLERHLNADDFLAVLGRSKSEFDSLPKEEREKIKKGRGLV